MRILKDGERANQEVLNRPHLDRGLVKMHYQEFNDNNTLDVSSLNIEPKGDFIRINESKLNLKNNKSLDIKVPQMDFYISNPDKINISNGMNTVDEMQLGEITTVLNALYAPNGTLTALDAEIEDHFAVSMALDGTRLIVGANQEDTAADNAGKVYVYYWNTERSIYQEALKLTASDAADNDFFGTSVALDGSRLVVSAQGSDNSGKVYVYEWNATDAVYDEVTILTASDAAANDFFGSSIALNGSRLIVGASHEDTAATDAGKVYVYDWNSSNSVYDEVTTLTASDASESDFFGTSASLDGNRLIIGATGNDTKGTATGKVYVYDWNSTDSVYDEVTSLTASDAKDNDHFASAVAVDGNRLIVGSQAEDSIGKVYVYDYNSSTSRYDEVITLTASDAEANDLFGTSIALDGNRLIVGAYQEGTAAEKAGKVYVYDAENMFTIARETIPNNTKIDIKEHGNSFFSNIPGKEAIMFIEYWTQKINTDGAKAYYGGFVQSDKLGDDITTEYNKAFRNLDLTARALNFQASSDEDRQTIADTSIILGEGLDFYQLTFRIRFEYGTKDVTLADLKAKGPLSSINDAENSDSTFTENAEFFKATVLKNDISTDVYAQELGRIQL